MEMKFDCDDCGFHVRGKDKDELAWIVASHILMNHPKMEISTEKAKDMLERA